MHPVVALLTYPVSASMARIEELTFEAVWSCMVEFHLLLDDMMTGMSVLTWNPNHGGGP
jgi:hypothetical protein